MAEKPEPDKITEEVKAKKSEKLVVKLEEPNSCPSDFHTRDEE